MRICNHEQARHCIPRGHICTRLQTETEACTIQMVRKELRSKSHGHISNAPAQEGTCGTRWARKRIAQIKKKEREP